MVKQRKNELQKLKILQISWRTIGSETSFFEAEYKLNSILDLKPQGLITRSIAQWTEQGERSTKYFFGLEKSNSKKKSIYKLVNDYVDLYEQEKISKHAVDFYSVRPEIWFRPIRPLFKIWFRFRFRPNIGRIF